MSRHGEIYQQLRRAILDGRFQAGDKLPASRALAAELGCARNTVVQAFELLGAHGLVETRHGAGTFVVGADRLPQATPAAAPGPAITPAAAVALSFRAARRRRELARPPAPLVDFQYGGVQVDARFAGHWRRAVAEAGRELDTEYQPPEGEARLRRALADHLRRRRRMAVDPEHILVTSGSQQALDLVARALLAPGREAVMEDPGYPGARVVFEASGAALRPCPVDRQGLIPEALPPRADLLYLTPSHQFPSGAVLSLGRRQALLEWAGRCGAWLFEDDYDSEFRHRGAPLETLHSLDRDGRVIYCGTLSKVLSPALRLGYLVLPEPLVEPLRALKWITDRASGQLEQRALARIIERGELERLIRRNGRRLATRRDALVEGLGRCFGAAVEISGSHTGLHLMAWFPALPAAAAGPLARRAAAEGVTVYPASSYFVAAPPACATLLLGYATVSSAQIQLALPRLAQAWRGLLEAPTPGRHGRSRRSEQP